MIRAVELLHPNAKMPFKKYADDAGWDHYLTEDLILEPREFKKIDLGIAIEVKKGQMLKIATRSSITAQGVFVAESVCDPGYTGSLMTYVCNLTSDKKEFKQGERVFQFIFLKQENSYQLQQKKLPISLRDKNLEGSTGKN